MIKAYLQHLGAVIQSHNEIKVGIGSSATGAASYKIGEVVENNNMWANVAHAAMLLSICVTVFTLFRGWYSFRKEWRKDRLEALKQADEISKLEAKVIE